MKIIVVVMVPVVMVSIETIMVVVAIDMGGMIAT
jgi:hypothetical protein